MHITTNQVNEIDELRTLVFYECGDLDTAQELALTAYPKKQQAELQLALRLLDGPVDETR